MKAVQFDAHGDRDDVSQYGDFPDPEPDRGEVLVDVKAGALNHLDIWTRVAGCPESTWRCPTFPAVTRPASPRQSARA